MNLRQSDHVKLFEVIGRIDNANLTKLTTAVDAAITQGHHQIVLDMGGVTYINSAGLRDLVRMYKRLERISGKLHIANPSQQVMRTLELVGLDSVLHIFFDPAWNFPRIPDQVMSPVQHQVCYLA
jgi:anti-anti-sigma factor